MRSFVFTVLMLFAVGGHAQVLPHHHLQVQLDPDSHLLQCVDEISVPPGSPRTLTFAIASSLRPFSADADLAALGGPASEGVTRYSVTLPTGRNSFTVSYSGTIFEPPRQEAREARVFETSRGIIAHEGAVLNGSSGWYPVLENAPGGGMINFALDATVPADWEAISQGKMTGRNIAAAEGRVQVSWKENHPQEEIHLIAAPFKEYRQLKDGVEQLVYLRTADDALAQRYLDATARYLKYYGKLIGDYPYVKFALVENFWETGYGMPSFTLLGSQVIRLPFIIDTSYPHEILHNWWGNGVYVDYQRGNWSEGLTAYLADHLLQEQKGTAAEYRRGALQKYADYVNAGRDFPLSAFVSRHSASSEAVGYSKAMMMFHMLRRMLGDDAFKQALRAFYAEFKFKRAGFSDLERSFSKSANHDLAQFFNQWVQRAGAPQLRLLAADSKPFDNGYELKVGVEQTQPDAPFVLDVPLAVTLEGEEYAVRLSVPMNDRKGVWTMRFAGKPLRVDVDPEFDVFRRLDSSEVPPALSQVFGSEQQTMVLPHAAVAELQQQYLAVATKWQQQAGPGAAVVWDDDIRALPETGSVWLFGWENRWRQALKPALADLDAELSQSSLRLNDSVYLQSANPLALVTHVGDTPVAWVAAPSAEIVPVLARKLPHYARYSYVVFEGEQLKNRAKGMWPLTRSAMQIAVRDSDGHSTEVKRGQFKVHESLSSD